MKWMDPEDLLLKQVLHKNKEGGTKNAPKLMQ